MAETEKYNNRDFERIDSALKAISSKLSVVEKLSADTRFQSKRLEQHEERLNRHSKKISSLQLENAAAKPQVKRNSDYVMWFSMMVVGAVVGGLIKSMVG